MSLLSLLSIPILSGFTLAHENLFPRDDPPASSSASGASSASPAPSSGSASPSATGSSGSLPNISSTSGAPATTSGPAGITNAPTVSGGQTYSYPPPSVPPTADAPFMQKSDLPNGTVFICVGAIIGGVFLAVFVWRAWAVWALHRRMNAANVEYVGVPSAPPTVTGSGVGSERKSAVLRKSGAGFYSQGGSGAGYNMGELRKGGLDRKPEYTPSTGGGSKSAAAARQSNLFFSPTAGAGAHGTAAQRASSYLPAGYYAAGSTVGSTVVNANSTSDLTASRSQLSMSDFAGPQRQTNGYKDSPLLRPQSGVGLEPPNVPFGRHAVARASTSSLGAGSERAPSAYLEDLFNTTPTEQRGSDETRRY